MGSKEGPSLKGSEVWAPVLEVAHNPEFQEPTPMFPEPGHPHRVGTRVTVLWHLDDDEKRPMLSVLM